MRKERLPVHEGEGRSPRTPHRMPVRGDPLAMMKLSDIVLETSDPAEDGPAKRVGWLALWTFVPPPPPPSPSTSTSLSPPVR